MPFAVAGLARAKLLRPALAFWRPTILSRDRARSFDRSWSNALPSLGCLRSAPSVPSTALGGDDCRVLQTTVTFARIRSRQMDTSHSARRLFMNGRPDR